MLQFAWKACGGQWVVTYGTTWMPGKQDYSNLVFLLMNTVGHGYNAPLVCILMLCRAVFCLLWWAISLLLSNCLLWWAFFFLSSFLFFWSAERIFFTAVNFPSLSSRFSPLPSRKSQQMRKMLGRGRRLSWGGVCISEEYCTCGPP